MRLISRRPLGAAALMAFGVLAGADAPPPRPSPGPVRPTPRATATLERAWPDHPQWAAMLVDILQGSQLGPGDGWFKKAVARTRFTWDATRSALDKDGNGVISRAEFAGPDAEFARLDRDRDGSLGPADFDFSAHALAPSPGATLFYQADQNSDGKVSPEEFQALFRSLDPDQTGFLCQDDLRRAFAPPGPKPGGSASRASGPSRSILLKGLIRQEIGSLQPGPAPGEPAPGFTLRTADAKDEIDLAKLVGPRPVVLIFGNFSCGPFRSQAGNVEKLHLRYGDRANFLMVYVREAHPTDGWQMESNDRAGVSIRQPRSYDERAEVARSCGRSLEFGFPMVVDTLDDAVGARYSGMPARLYLIDRRGEVAYQSGRGPYGFKIPELEQSLLLLLDEERRNESRSAIPGPR
jgi:hypothetical protein